MPLPSIELLTDLTRQQRGVVETTVLSHRKGDVGAAMARAMMIGSLMGAGVSFLDAERVAGRALSEEMRKFDASIEGVSRGIPPELLAEQQDRIREQQARIREQGLAEQAGETELSAGETELSAEQKELQGTYYHDLYEQAKDRQEQAKLALTSASTGGTGRTEQEIQRWLQTVRTATTSEDLDEILTQASRVKEGFPRGEFIRLRSAIDTRRKEVTPTVDPGSGESIELNTATQIEAALRSNSITHKMATSLLKDMGIAENVLEAERMVLGWGIDDPEADPAKPTDPAKPDVTIMSVDDYLALIADALTDEELDQIRKRFEATSWQDPEKRELLRALGHRQATIELENVDGLISQIIIAADYDAVEVLRANIASKEYSQVNTRKLYHALSRRETDFRKASAADIEGIRTRLDVGEISREVARSLLKDVYKDDPLGSDKAWVAKEASALLNSDAWRELGPKVVGEDPETTPLPDPGVATTTPDGAVPLPGQDDGWSAQQLLRDRPYYGDIVGEGLSPGDQWEYFVGSLPMDRRASYQRPGRQQLLRTQFGLMADPSTGMIPNIVPMPGQLPPGPGHMYDFLAGGEARGGRPTAEDLAERVRYLGQATPYWTAGQDPTVPTPPGPKGMPAVVQHEPYTEEEKVTMRSFAGRFFNPQAEGSIMRGTPTERTIAAYLAPALSKAPAWMHQHIKASAQDYVRQVEQERMKRGAALGSPGEAAQLATFLQGMFGGAISLAPTIRTV